MPTLKRGSQGAEVRALQQKLSELGFYRNEIDGKFGAGTEKAVRAFQKASGLQVDGKVGKDTRAALKLNGAAVAAGVGAGGVSTVPASGIPMAVNAPALNFAALSGKVPAAVLVQIPETAARFGITTNLRLAHFLAQCKLESTGFTATVENLNYSAPRILKIFKKYFKNVDPAGYAHNPEKLGSRVYANRMGNGDEASGEGFRYRGRGYIQLTGKNNYRSFSQFVGEDCVANPDLVATKYPLSSAAFYFSSNNIWTICDAGANDATVERVSIAVNGNPPHALAERTTNFKEFINALV